GPTELPRPGRKPHDPARQHDQHEHRREVPAMTRYERAMRVRRRTKSWAARAGALLLTALPALASAQNVLSVPNTTAAAGDANVAIPIDYTGPDLTHLQFDVNFDPSFCATLVNPAAITLVPSTAMACTSDCSNGGTSCASSVNCTSCTMGGGCQPRTKTAPL